jgi:hypothetical protein
MTAVRVNPRSHHWPRRGEQADPRSPLPSDTSAASKQAAASAPNAASGVNALASVRVCEHTYHV